MEPGSEPPRALQVIIELFQALDIPLAPKNFSTHLLFRFFRHYLGHHSDGSSARSGQSEQVTDAYF